LPALEGLEARISDRKQTEEAITVTGAVSPNSLGPTLMHEHLFIDWFERIPMNTSPTDLSYAAIRRMQQAGWPIPRNDEQARFFNATDLHLSMIDMLRRGGRMRATYRINDERLIRNEVAAFAVHGGRTIVDLTPYGFGRDPVRLRRLARVSGLNVIMGTGWYRWPFHPDEVATMSVAQLAAVMIRDIQEGGPGGVRAGIIGEIPVDSRSVRIALPQGESLSDSEVSARSGAVLTRLLSVSAAERDSIDPAEVYDAAEVKVLQAAARASRITGASLSIHCVDPWIGYLRLIEAEGADLRRVIISHADSILADRALLSFALDRGVVLEADYKLQYYPTQSPVGDVDGLVASIAWVVGQGHSDQILLSLDICSRVGLLRYGGGGYATLYNHILPKLRAAGVSQVDIERIMVDNPRRMLTLVERRP
jgi:phosphotriesterase-related protein